MLFNLSFLFFFFGTLQNIELNKLILQILLQGSSVINENYLTKFNNNNNNGSTDKLTKIV